MAAEGTLALMCCWAASIGSWERRCNGLPPLRLALPLPVSLPHAFHSRCSHPLQDIDRVKAGLSRPGSLTAGLNYYRAAIAQGTKWRLEAAEK